MPKQQTPQNVYAQKDQAKLSLGKRLGSGGETSVSSCQERPKIAIGIPHVMTPEKHERLQFLTAWFPAIDVLSSFAWPKEIVTDSSGKIIGFTMQRVEGELLSTFVNPHSCPSNVTLNFVLKTLLSLAAAIHAAHASGFRIGDLNDFNVMVRGDGSVVVLDVLSFYFNHVQKVFSTDAGVPEFLPPELQQAFRDGNLGNQPRTVHGDSWAFGVLVFRAVMGGHHPFSNRELKSVDEVVHSGEWPHSPNSRLHPKSACPPLTSLPPILIDLFRKCFEVGAGDPVARPLMIEWHRALSDLVQPESKPQASKPRTARQTQPTPATSPTQSVKNRLLAPVFCLLLTAVACISLLLEDKDSQGIPDTPKQGKETPQIWMDLKHQAVRRDNR